jgi:hypothetical protein
MYYSLYKKIKANGKKLKKSLGIKPIKGRKKNFNLMMKFTFHKRKKEKLTFIKKIKRAVNTLFILTQNIINCKQTLY